ncbi:GroES-like zinc-binding alcohol dehydrogenase family protein [Gossypium australe]|uniref:GroES-like zinc-binding alcohol dehydrogenase family protein n=1 Tax=Gossypium australe TaxID=47621 RepID=A0A5B6UPL6_9ROSI|nr:GroES-like zinc-binding alcohol dehydrogenase family protein [Gossypium australe]
MKWMFMWFGLDYSIYRKVTTQIALLGAIGQAIGLVVKLDAHTSSGRRGRFVRLAGCVDFRKPLVSKIKISGHIQRIEYESLPIICFNCGIFGYNSNMCKGTKNNSPKSGVGGRESAIEKMDDQ